jgi:hypothetical protein
LFFLKLPAIRILEAFEILFRKEVVIFSPDGSGILLFWRSEQKIERTAGA